MVSASHEPMEDSGKPICLSANPKGPGPGLHAAASHDVVAPPGRIFAMMGGSCAKSRGGESRGFYAGAKPSPPLLS